MGTYRLFKVLFLINRNDIIINLDVFLQENLYYGTKDEQVQLLQKVLAATEQDAEEEKGGEPGSQVCQGVTHMYTVF